MPGLAVSSVLLHALWESRLPGWRWLSASLRGRDVCRRFAADVVTQTTTRPYWLVLPAPRRSPAPRLDAPTRWTDRPQEKDRVALRRRSRLTHLFSFYARS